MEKANYTFSFIPYQDEVTLGEERFWADVTNKEESDFIINELKNYVAKYENYYYFIVYINEKPQTNDYHKVDNKFGFELYITFEPKESFINEGYA